MLAAELGAAEKIAAQSTGDFYLVRDAHVTAIRSDESFMRTEQLAEERIAGLAGARRTRPTPWAEG